MSPQAFVAVIVTVSAPAPLSALYVTDFAPLPVPAPGEMLFPRELVTVHDVALVSVNEMVAVLPNPTGLAEMPTPLIVGSGFTGMVTDPDFEQPLPLVTVTLSVTGPDEPVSKVMELDP